MKFGLKKQDTSLYNIVYNIFLNCLGMDHQCDRWTNGQNSDTLFMCVTPSLQICFCSTGIGQQSVRHYRKFGFRRDSNPWRVPKFDKKQSLYQQELTKENAAFLEQTVLDKYKDVVKDSHSPLKDGPWQRSEWTVKYVKFLFKSQH